MLKYWLWLVTRHGLGSRGVRSALERFGTPEAAFYADRDSCTGLSDRETAALLHKDLTEPEIILDACYEKKIGILTIQDAQYPLRLRGIDDPPAVLYYKGRIPDLNAQPAVAVVGSRDATPYGLLTAKRLGYQLGRCGMAVVSGMARGIDRMGMEGALSAGSPVVGVLGCGADIIYPRENEKLYEDVESRGCILTEFPPGTPPEGRNFPVRNRILSGLSLGVVVVEASSKSGALITASCALEQGRDVFAVPGNIGVAACAGSNRLIREGAILVESGWDVAQEYAAIYPEKLHEFKGGEQLRLTPEQTAGIGRKVAQPVALPQADDKKVIDKEETGGYIDLHKTLADLTGDERTLLALLGEKPAHVDDLIDLSQFPASRALATLTLLEVKGLAVRLPGNRYRLQQ